MDQLPGNSHNQKREAEQPKKIEKVVVGEVVVQKKPWHKRMVASFFAGRADVAAESVIQDVMLPAARGALFDMGTSFLDNVINGNRTTRALSNRLLPGQSVGQYVGMQAQQQFAYNNVMGKQVPGQPAPVPQQAAAGYGVKDFGQLRYGTRPEANAVLEYLHLTIAEYNAVTVSDLYAMSGITAEYTADGFGWTDITGAGVLPARGGGYVLNLPTPIALD